MVEASLSQRVAPLAPEQLVESHFHPQQVPLIGPKGTWAGKTQHSGLLPQPCCSDLGFSETTGKKSTFQ